MSKVRTVELKLELSDKGLVAKTQANTKALRKYGITANEAGQRVRFLGSQVGKLHAYLGSTAVIYGTIRTVSALTGAYKTQEQAVAKLNASIESMNRTTPNLSNNLQNLAAQIQTQGVIGDEALIEGQSFLTTYSTISDEMLPRVTRVMADFAAKMGGNTVQAANMLGKASMGMTGELSRIGITLSEQAKESKDFAMILGEIESQVQGMNVALARTDTGKLDQISNALGDVQESWGKGITAELTPVLVGLTNGLLDAQVTLEGFNDEQTNTALAVQHNIDWIARLGLELIAVTGSIWAMKKANTALGLSTSLLTRDFTKVSRVLSTLGRTFLPIAVITGAIEGFRYLTTAGDALTHSLEELIREQENLSVVKQKNIKLTKDETKELDTLLKKQREYRIQSLERTIATKERDIKELERQINQVRNQPLINDAEFGSPESLKWADAQEKLLLKSKAALINYRAEVRHIKEQIAKDTADIAQKSYLTPEESQLNSLISKFSKDFAPKSDNPFDAKIAEFEKRHNNIIQQATKSNLTQNKEYTNWYAQATDVYEDLINQRDAKNAELHQKELAREQEALQRYKQMQLEKLQAQNDWHSGAQLAFMEYYDNAANLTQQYQELFTKGFQSMEDALVDFATTGKLNFKNLANSIIADMIRIQIRQRLIGMFSMALGGNAAIAKQYGTNIGSEQTSMLAEQMRDFNGGGYTGNAPRVGGVDGQGGFMAILHPQETVIDHTKPLMTKGSMNANTAPVNITVIANGQNTVSKRQSQRNDGTTDVAILIDQVDDALGERVSNGSGSLYQAITRRK